MSRLVLLLACLSVLRAGAQTSAALKLVQTIPLPGVEGRIDHLTADAAGHRLFVAALGNDTVEVVDFETGKRLHTIAGCSEPQGLVYLPKRDELFVANGGSGEVKIYDAGNFQPVKTIGSLPDADNVRYDAANNKVYVGFGDGALAVLDAAGNLAGKIQLDAHPESFQIEQGGDRIFVNVPEARAIAVVDRARQTVASTWPEKSPHSNFPMALDETDHRLFVGCRSPARLLVLDANNGKTVATLEIPGDTDDVFYDAARKRIYVSGGEGFVGVISQKDADSYTELERIPTAPGARTSLFIPEANLLCVAAPHRGDRPAEIRVFKAGP